MQIRIRLLLQIGNYVMRARVLFHTFLLLLVFVSIPAHAATYYVSKDGNDSWSGLYDTLQGNPPTDGPWLTIQKAANTLIAGDTVYIREGTYIERVIPQNSGSLDSYITYQNYPGDEVIIESPNTWGYDCCILLPEDISLHYLRFIGLKLQKANWANFRANAIDSYPKSNIILENMSSDSSYIGIYFSNGVTDSKIKNCEIHYNQYGIELYELNQNILIDGNHVSHSQIIRPDVEPYWSHNIVIFTNRNYPGKENTNITITNNHVHHSRIQGILVWHGKNILVKGNHCHHNGATGIQIEADGTDTGPITENIVVEDNVCEYNSQNYDNETGIWIDDTDNCLVQNNILRHNNIGFTITGSRQVIGRNNQIYKNNESYVGKNITLRAIRIEGGERGGYDDIVVHNTLYGNSHLECHRGGVSIGAYADYTIERVILKNNIIAKNAGRDLWIRNLSHSLDYNDYYDTDELTVNWQGDDVSWSEYLSVSGWDSNSITSAPLFVDTTIEDFHLQAASPCVDSACFLTKTTNSGSGTVITVEDARYFTDGFGVIEGDLIQVGSNIPVRVTDVDYEGNVITVNEDISWENGNAVSYPYEGSAPDIGAFEYGVDTTQHFNSFFLYQNDPNPFNIFTEIKFYSPYESRVKLIIYDLLGRQIRILFDSLVEEGTQTVEWDGTDCNGKKVGGGIYFYQLKAQNGFASAKKMIFLK